MIIRFGKRGQTELSIGARMAACAQRSADEGSTNSDEQSTTMWTCGQPGANRVRIVQAFYHRSTPVLRPSYEARSLPKKWVSMAENGRKSAKKREKLLGERANLMLFRQHNNSWCDRG